MRRQSAPIKPNMRAFLLMTLFTIGLELWLAPGLPAQAATLFETSADRAARTDLQRLEQAESRYWTEHHAYTGVFSDLGPPTFEATKGIYLQVETADQTHFRAVAMPRESHTARVFALEANGGKSAVKELEEKEVSTYVLGALQKIRSSQRLKLSLAAFSTAGLLGLLIYGVILHQRGVAGQWRASAPYFLGLVPLYVTLILSTFVDELTYIGPLVLGMAVAGVIGGVSSILIGIVTLWQSITQKRDFHFLRLALVGILFAVLGIVSPFYTFYPHLPWIGDLTSRPSAHQIFPP